MSKRRVRKRESTVFAVGKKVLKERELEREKKNLNVLASIFFVTNFEFSLFCGELSFCPFVFAGSTIVELSIPICYRDLVNVFRGLYQETNSFMGSLFRNWVPCARK